MPRLPRRRAHLAPKKHLPRSGTRATVGFFASWAEINRFFHFVLDLVHVVENTSQIAHQALVETEHDEEKRKQIQAEWNKRISAVEKLRINRQFFMEVILVRHIENFLNYVAALLYDIFVTRPETLRSSDKLEVASVLQHDSIESLILDVAERKVESLSYSSFGDLSQFFRERFHLILADGEQMKLLLEAIETRNISVHNRCVMNKRYISRLELGPENLGKKRALGIEYLDEVVPMLAELVRAIDKQARVKLKLRGFRFAKTIMTSSS